jgi:hypothetical protein
MAEIQIKIVLDAAHIGRTDSVCQSLSTLGMKVETTYPEIGVIFGSAEESLLSAFTAAEGVEQAVPEGTMIALDRVSGTKPR